MKKDDYFVLVYKILAYLYACLKDGIRPDLEYFSAEWLKIPARYWEYIFYFLIESRYISGAECKAIMLEDCSRWWIKIYPEIMITPDGIEYLCTTPIMEKAKDSYQQLMQSIPK